MTEGLSVSLHFLQLEDNERTGVDADVFCDSLMCKQLCSQLCVWPTIEPSGRASYDGGSINIACNTRLIEIHTLKKM